MFKDLDHFLDPNKLEKVLKPIMIELAHDYRKALIKNIKSNKFGFRLAQSTIQSRLNSGIRKTTPLIFTGDYIKSIIVEGTTVTVKSGKHYSGLTYEELTFILEYGRRDKSIPPFPVWRKTRENMRAYADEKITKAMEMHYKISKSKQ